MLKNFEEIKTQLKELAEVINAYNSEAVQIRLVELVFGYSPPDEESEEEEAPHPPSRKKARKRASKKAAEGEPPTQKRGARSGKPGARATLTELIAGGFFSKPRGLADIVSHCDTNLARKFKQSDLSGPLARLTSDKVLKREKDENGQYKYSKA